MMLKLDRDHLAAELSDLNSLLESLPENDLLGRVGLEARRDEVRRRYEGLADYVERKAKIALYFGGDPVVGSAGIEVGFGTHVVGTFQDLISKVWGTADGAQLMPMGPVRDREEAQLHITNLVHGSFGFLLEELDQTGEPMFETPLKKAADQVSEYIVNFASESEAAFFGVIEDLNPRVFQSIRQFFAYMHSAKATFRLVEGERDEKFDHFAVERAWYRAESSKVDEEHVHVRGRLLGVIPMRRRFEFEPDDGNQIIEGKVGEKFSQSYLERISTEQFAGRRWKALLHKRTVEKAGRMPVDKYTLLELDEIGETATR